jgi:hypothetical protein
MLAAKIYLWNSKNLLDYKTNMYVVIGSWTVNNLIEAEGELDFKMFRP